MYLEILISEITSDCCTGIKCSGVKYNISNIDINNNVDELKCKAVESRHTQVKYRYIKIALKYSTLKYGLILYIVNQVTSQCLIVQNLVKMCQLMVKEQINSLVYYIIYLLHTFNSLNNTLYLLCWNKQKTSTHGSIFFLFIVDRITRG